MLLQLVPIMILIVKVGIAVMGLFLLIKQISFLLIYFFQNNRVLKVEFFVEAFSMKSF